MSFLDSPEKKLALAAVAVVSAGACAYLLTARRHEDTPAGVTTPRTNTAPARTEEIVTTTKTTAHAPVTSVNEGDTTSVPPTEGDVEESIPLEVLPSPSPPAPATSSREPSLADFLDASQEKSPFAPELMTEDQANAVFERLLAEESDVQPAFRTTPNAVPCCGVPGEPARTVLAVEVSQEPGGPMVTPAEYVAALKARNRSILDGNMSQLCCRVVDYHPSERGHGTTTAEALLEACDEDELLSGPPPLEEGRKLRGNRFAFVCGPEYLRQIFELADQICWLTLLGFRESSVRRKIAAGHTFSLLVFERDDTPQVPVTWDAVFDDILPLAFPDDAALLASVAAYRHALPRLTPEELYEHADQARVDGRLAGTDALAVQQRKTALPHLTPDEYMEGPRALYETRRLLKTTLWLTDLFGGNGFCENEAGERTVPEYLVGARRLADLPGLVVCPMSP